MREIRTLRAMWRVLETEPRQFLTGHEEGNLGYMPRKSLRATAPVPDPTGFRLVYVSPHDRTLNCPMPHARPAVINLDPIIDRSFSTSPHSTITSGQTTRSRYRSYRDECC